jgi:serine/threonine-protein kinase
MSEPELPPPFGRYQPLARLGAGAIGTVYRAHDPLIDRYVAIKVIRLDALDPEQQTEYRERFRTEAQAGGRCSHPAIIGIFDAGEAQGQPFLVMEYVEGRSLQAILADPAARLALNAVDLMAELLAALGYAHARGIIHRDIKPANVMVTPDFRVKVADFGIARLDGGSVTQVGDMLGTPSYMAPEQVTGAAVDHRADLFSAAAIFFAMLAGRPPFAGRSLPDTLMRLTNADEVDLTALAGPFANFAPVLRQGLAKNPAHRFPNAAAFAAALRDAAEYLGDEDVTRIVGGARASTPIPQAVIDTAALQLAVFLGPMARLEVAKAARLAANEDEFFAMLGQTLPNPQDATKFLRAAGRSNATLTGKLLTPTSPTQLPLRGISPQAAEAARAILAPYTGPIAKLLVAKAMAEAPSLDTMIDRLVDAANRPDAAPALRAKLQEALSKNA